jgi:hypothetical protein
MKRVLIISAAIAWPLLTAGSCATTQVAEPRIVTVEVAVPVSSPCVPAKLGAAPEYPDTKEALQAAPDAASRLQLFAAGWPLKLARLNELEPVVAGCPKAAK